MLFVLYSGKTILIVELHFVVGIFEVCFFDVLLLYFTILRDYLLCAMRVYIWYVICVEINVLVWMTL